MISVCTHGGGLMTLNISHRRLMDEEESLFYGRILLTDKALLFIAVPKRPHPGPTMHGDSSSCLQYSSVTGGRVAGCTHPAQGW